MRRYRRAPSHEGREEPHFTCPGCGKQAFLSRKSARRQLKRLYPEDRDLYAYECSTAPGNWHKGHMSANVKSGRIGREVQRK